MLYYSWDFGDNAKSTVQHPEHTFSSPGEYTVKLLVTNIFGNDETSVDIKVTPVVPLDSHDIFLPLMFRP
jgi:PKD repeat protein